ncbi:MAG: hypothetical protein NT049_18195 [Planctomycetota bacterium]|nr:hypothetical protein [Planctomycetota bacterium]
MPDKLWLMRIEGALSAHFKQEDGPSRPGLLWTVGMKHGETYYKVMVRAMLTDDATTETREDQEYQGRTVMQYLHDQIEAGWRPEDEHEHTIYIGNRLQGGAENN